MTKAMVLAAGKGTRLLPLTSEVPKPVAPVVGKPIIQHIFELLDTNGIEEVEVNLYHLADVVLDHYGDRSRLKGMDIRFSREEKLMGTAGGVKRLADRFDGTFVVIMGDALTDVDLREVVDFHKEHEALATLALTRVEDTSQYGVVELAHDNNIRNFQEKPRPHEAISTLANTGIYVLEPEVLGYIPEDSFYDFAGDVFPRLLEAGERFLGYEGDFYWSDVGTLRAYRAAQRDALSGKVQVRIPGERLGERAWVDRDAHLDPTVSLHGSVVVGRGAVVGRGVELGGYVAVGSGCRIELGATVYGSVLMAGCQIGAGAYVEDCILGPGCEVRAGEQIRGGALVRGMRERVA